MQTANEKYVEEMGCICPQCGSTDIQSLNNLEASDGVAWQTINCTDCGAEWRDVYELTGFQLIKGA